LRHPVPSNETNADEWLPMLHFPSNRTKENAVEDGSQPTYRTLHMLVKHGDRGVLVLTVGVLLLGLLAVVMTGALWAAPLVLVGTGLLYVVARSYVELVRVIVDMLLPK